MGRHCQNTRPLKKETAATWRAPRRLGAAEFGPGAKDSKQASSKASSDSSVRMRIIRNRPLVSRGTLHAEQGHKANPSIKCRGCSTTGNTPWLTSAAANVTETDRSLGGLTEFPADGVGRVADLIDDFLQPLARDP